MLRFDQIMAGGRYRMTLRQSSPRVLHDSIEMNESLVVEVQRAMSDVLVVTVISRLMPSQMVLRAAVERGIVDFDRL